MQIGALGDIHGDFARVRQVMSRHPDVPVWISVGDVADDAGGYEAFGTPLLAIKGNNDNYDAIDAGALPSNLTFLPNGTRVSLGGISVAGLGGTFARPGTRRRQQTSRTRAKAVREPPPRPTNGVTSCARRWSGASR